MIDERLRGDVERRLRPMVARAGRSRLRADHLTLLGLVMAVGTAVAIGAGALRAAVLLLVLTAVPDALDGAVAKATGTASPRGAFFDSVADRVSDALLLGGVAWFLAGDGGAHLVILPLALLAMSMLVSYERAKAESLGFSAKGGIMERAERLIALGIGLLFDSLLVPILWVMLALTTFTAVQRFAKVWRQASALPAEPLADRWRRRRVGRRRTSSLRQRTRSRRA
jgi:CDP-diacylglycerol--glycerol-3-phosphate 3-phosphatidyltransferase